MVVVTASPATIAADMLRAVGLRADALHAGVWAAAKARPLRDERCWALVGDHAEDMRAARETGSIAVGVATGTSRPTGADVELDDLTAFPMWLDEPKQGAVSSCVPRLPSRARLLRPP